MFITNHKITLKQSRTFKQEKQALGSNEKKGGGENDAEEKTIEMGKRDR